MQQGWHESQCPHLATPELTRCLELGCEGLTWAPGLGCWHCCPHCCSGPPLQGCLQQLNCSLGKRRASVNRLSATDHLALFPKLASTYWWHRSACQPLRLCHCYYCCCSLRCHHHFPRSAGHWGAGAGQCWARWHWVGPQPGHRGQEYPSCGWELDWPWGPGHLEVLLG